MDVCWVLILGNSKQLLIAHFENYVTRKYVFGKYFENRNLKIFHSFLFMCCMLVSATVPTQHVLVHMQCLLLAFWSASLKAVSLWIWSLRFLLGWKPGWPSFLSYLHALKSWAYSGLWERLLYCVGTKIKLWYLWILNMHS